MFMQYLDATDDFPFFAGRKAKIQFIELHANTDRSSILPMQRPRPRLGPAAAASLNKYTPGLVSPPPPHRGGSGGGGCSGVGRGARAAGGRGEPGLVRPPRTAARHPAIGAGGRTAARRVRMMKLSKPPASPPRRTAAAGADTCARAAEAAREGGRGPRGRHPESGPGGHAGMWIGEGAGGGRGGLDAPSKPLRIHPYSGPCARSALLN